MTTATVKPSDPWSLVMRALPGGALGIFAARLIGELVGMPSWTAAIALSMVLVLAMGWLFAHWPLRWTWPALILLAYVVYPEPDLALGAFVAAVAALTWTQVAAERLHFRAGRRLHVASFVGLITIFFTLYVRTLAPGVLPADSGELQVVAATLGVAHPPGFPLYTMLGYLWTLLPIGSGPAYRLNLFSAVTSTMTLAMVYLTVMKLSGRRPILAAMTAAVTLGTSTTFWSQATTANIRSLTVLFTAITFYCLVRFGKSTSPEDETLATGSKDRWLILAALSLGLGITHHISLAFLAMVSLVYVLLTDRTLWPMPRRWVWPLVAGLAGLLPLLYLPLRAESGARGASPQLATIGGFLDHILATGFRGDLFYFTDPVTFWQRLRVIGVVLTFQFAPVLLVGMAVGLFLLLIHDRLLALLWGGTILVFTFVAATYRAPQTVEYLMPAYVAMVLCLGYAVGHVPRLGRTASRPGLAANQVFSALVLVSALNQGWQRFGSFDALHREADTREVAQALLAATSDNGVVLAHWHWATPVWYLQEIEGERPDVSAEFVFPEGEDYVATWAKRARSAYESGSSVVTTFYDPVAFAGMPAPDPAGEGYLFRQEPISVLPSNFEPLDVILGGVVELIGYRQGASTTQAGEPIELTLAWRPLGDAPEGLSLFAHLIGPDDSIYGQDDVPVSPHPEGITFTQLRVTPRPSTPLETLLIAVGAYAAEPLLNEVGEARLPISNVAIEPNVLAPFTQQPLARKELSAAGRQMVGYDWDRTLTERGRLYLHWKLANGYWTEARDTEPEMSEVLNDLPPYRGPWGVPQVAWKVPAFSAASHYVPFGKGITWTGESIDANSYVPDETLTLDQRLHSDRPILRDYVVSTRLIGLQGESSLWAWWDLVDSIPGLGAVPTLKWIQNSSILSPHRLTVDANATAGQRMTGALILYDAFTNRPLPILDERLTAESPWVPLGNSHVED